MGSGGRRRRLVQWTNLDAAGGRSKFQRDDGKKVDVTPIRFVGACKKGHLQDIDWRWLLHRGDRCSEPMWIEEDGTSADPASIRIGCLCDRVPLSLADVFKPGFLGRCRGERPWLDTPDADCDENLHFLSRSATNTYFAQTVTVISLPIHEDALGEAVRKHWTSLQGAADPPFVAILRSVPEIGASLHGHSDEDVFERIRQLREQDRHKSSIHPKIEEFDLLGNGRNFIGRDAEREPLFAETLQTIDLAVCRTVDGHQLLDGIVAVHRLKAVTCLYGFTRLEPAPTMSESLLEDVRLAVNGAPLAEAADWLPALEQKGEGIFLKVSPAAVRGWIGRSGVPERGALLERANGTNRPRLWISTKFTKGTHLLVHWHSPGRSRQIRHSDLYRKCRSPRHARWVGRAFRPDPRNHFNSCRADSTLLQ